MSNYNKIIPTLAGSNLLAESIKSKKPLIFTRIALGDGMLTESESIESLTALKHPMAQNDVQAINIRGNGEIDVVATISNATVTSGFYARELGVFAKVGDTGTEKLFAYTNAGAQASYTPAGTSLDEKLITVTFYIGNDVNVKINLNSQIYINYQQLEEGIARHNTDEHAHSGLLQKVKTDLATHDTNISSHPAITTMIAKILGTTNWQENPAATLKDIKNLLGMGGIVAQRLDANGYVKFANGFTVQWGYGNPNYEDLTGSKKTYRCRLPIAFEHRVLFAAGQTETNDKVNHFTFVNINHAPEESTKEEVVFYTWIDWDWSYVKFRLAWMAFGY